MMSISWLLACILVAVAVVVIFQAIRTHLVLRRRMKKLTERVPGPPGIPVLGNALLFMAKPEELLTILIDLINKYGDYIKLWLGPDLLICIKNPSDIRLLLTSNKINQKGPMYHYLKPLIGPGVLTEGGLTWRNHRKIANSSYSKKTVQRYATVFNANAKELAEVLCTKDPTEIFNVYWDVVACTTQNVCQTIVGLSKDESKQIKRLDELVKETHNMYNFIFANMTRWWFHIPFFYWLCGRKTMEKLYVAMIDEMTSDMLMRRRKALAERTLSEEELGVVDRFILSEELTDQEIKWETMTFFTASQEASAKIASMCLKIFAHLPEWQEKVYNEILELLGPDDDFVSEEQVKRLQYLDMVYKEAIRYLPIAAFIQRTVEEEIAINQGKITLPVGAAVVIPIYALHRDSRYWDDPYLVDPGKFLPENVQKRDPNAYVPFSLGAMDCIGRVFAESMIKIMLIRVLRRVHLSAEGKIEDLHLNVAISVSFADGYNLRARRRSDNRHQK